MILFCSNIEPTIIQYATRAVTVFDSEIETKSMNISPPCVEEQRDAVTLPVKQRGQNIEPKSLAALPHREVFIDLVSISESNSNGHCARCVLCGSRFNIRRKSTT